MNKYTRSIDSTLLKNKLDKISELLQTAAGSADFNTKESLLSEAMSMLSEFYEDLAAPLFDPKPVLPGDPSDPEEYNRDINSIANDLLILFTELENIEAIILANFNYYVSQSDRLNSRLKSIASKLGDFSLYASNSLGDSIYFTDSFNNLDKIEFGSKLLNATQAEIDQAEGIITLPINQSPNSLIKITETPVINSNSNGVLGNNQELGLSNRHSNILDLLDNNPDTWVEYERVVNVDDGTALILDLTVNLGSAQILNFVRINPNNFGTKTQIEIDDIATSIDGKIYISIKDEIPIPGFNVIDEPNVFSLAPSTSKYAGQGLYTFTPRTAKYIHLVLRQTTPYLIQTQSGPRLRYAIGIRDIEAQAFQYLPKGEFVSNSLSANDEIVKLSVVTTQSPTNDSSLVAIEHQISPDDGHTWYTIRSEASLGDSGIDQTTPEVLSFNTNQPNSISTASPVTSLRYKGILSRDGSAFKDGNSALKESIKFTTELHQVPLSTPFNISLTQPPVANSVEIIDPNMGSRAIKENVYKLSIGTASAQTYQLPLTNIPQDVEKYQVNGVGPYYIRNTPSEVFTVDGVQWTRGNLASSSAVATVYELDAERGILRTGDGSHGRALEAGASASLSFTPERLLVEKTKDGFVANLGFPTNGDKKSMTIERFDTTSHESESVDKGVSRIVLQNQNLITSGIRFSDNSTFATRKAFIDGKTELLTTGDYSIDFEQGIIYSKNITSSSGDTTVSYSYRPSHILSEDEWDFLGNKQTIAIKNIAWVTTTVLNEAIPSAVNKFSLANFSIEEGSLQFTTPSGVTTFSKEVDFTNGTTELLALVKATELIPDGILAGSGLKEFHLTMTPGSSNYTVRFSNLDVFKTDTSPSDPVSVGQYSIVGNRIRVIISSTVSSPGSVSYFYSDPAKDMTGAYSVDYKLGNVYTHDSTASNCTVSYKFAEFQAKYPISRVVPTADYTVDLSSQQITLSDREIIRKTGLPGNLTKGISSNTYQVLYNYVDKTRSNIADLEPYFSPVLKDYTIRVLTKGKLLL